jgi:3-phenylpropionate/trans-cinnamate dioxygenase ferredoxin subunit
MRSNWYRIAQAVEIPVKGMRAFSVGGRDVVVCNTREGFFALDNTCSHAEAKMNEGRLRGCRIICPLHGGSFDIRDGTALGSPAVSPLRSYAIRVVDGEIEVELGDSLPIS